MPSGLTASVADASFGDRISHLVCDHDLFNILSSFTFKCGHTSVIITDLGINALIYLVECPRISYFSKHLCDIFNTALFHLSIKYKYFT